jgi:hypothetical protein
MTAERLAELVTAAAYGTVLVLAALSVVGVSDVALGHGAELVAGVGAASWLAHLFAALLGGHVRDRRPLGRDAVQRAMVDGSPILGSAVLPGFVLMLGRLDVLSDGAARVTAILVALAQLLAIGAYVGRTAPSSPASAWVYAGVTCGVGVAVVAATVFLGH